MTGLTETSMLGKKSMDLIKLVYNETKRLPHDEDYGLKSQLRRAAVSVPSNIAEGLTRKTANDKIHFLNMAQASLSEIPACLPGNYAAGRDTQIEIALRLGYVQQSEYESIETDLMEIQKLFSGLTWSLN
jgi:four helix bundle protein